MDIILREVAEALHDLWQRRHPSSPVTAEPFQVDGLDHVDIRSGDDTRQPQAPGWQILTAIVREHPRRLSSDLDSRLWGEETGYKPAADILAIMRVLKRRDPTLDRVIIDLTHADPAEVDLSNAKLSDASLSGASFAVGLTVQDSHAGDFGALLHELSSIPVIANSAPQGVREKTA